MCKWRSSYGLDERASFWSVNHAVWDRSWLFLGLVGTNQSGGSLTHPCQTKGLRDRVDKTEAAKRPKPPLPEVMVPIPLLPTSIKSSSI